MDLIEQIKKIEKYVDRFITKTEVNDKYDMSAFELRSLAERARCEEPLKMISLTFSYGYVKGYRSALDEMKKGGKTSCR